MSRSRKSPSWITRFSAVVKYELLWNIRKKKFFGMIVLAFALATLSLVLPVILSNIVDQPLSQNPDYVISTGTGIGGLGFFLFAIVTVMNSISGEFESGTIVPLLTKPVSRTTIFIGKMFAAFLTLFTTYVILIGYLAIGGTIVYGVQNNLHLLPISLMGNILSTFVWIAIVLAIGSISKSSMIAALVTFGIWMGLTIASPIISMFSDQTWILHYVIGSGATGYVEGLGSPSPLIPGMPTSTGTDSIATNLINYILYPSANVTFFKIGIHGPGLPPGLVELYTEALSLVVLRSVLVATAYILVFSLISWYAFRRAQVLQ